MPDKIREGTVLLAETLPEREDVRNAAQAILIDYMQSRLMTSFRRPPLPRKEAFYAEFFGTYMRLIREEELRIWEEIGREVDTALAGNPLRELTEKEAAYLTIAMLGHPEGPSSMELYMNLAFYAQGHETLLKEKYGDWYAPGIFYRALRAHMPRFLLRLIGMDSITGILLTMNARPRDHIDSGSVIEPDTVIDERLMELGEDDSYGFAPKFVEAVCEHAREQAFTEDAVGRTEDRGCPVLYSGERDAIISFAIEELVAQHERYYQTD
jgi:hypothetical protein